MSVEISRLTTTPKTLYQGVTQVSTSAIPVAPQVETNQGIILRAPGTVDVDSVGAPLGNTGLVYVGDARVTADHSTTGGFPLCPGMSIVLPIKDPSLVYVIATKPGQVVQWIGL
jgi:hypothetical protein